MDTRGCRPGTAAVRPDSCAVEEIIPAGRGAGFSGGELAAVLAVAGFPQLDSSGCAGGG